MTKQEIREHCNDYGYSDEEVGAFNDGYQQGRADAIDELQKLYLDWQKEIKDFYYADEETTRFLKRLKTHLNLDEVQKS